MNSLPIEFWVILAGAGAAALAVVLIRFGKQIARALLVLAGVILATIVALALLGQTLATRQQAEAIEVATATNAAQSGFVSFLAGAVVVLVLVLLGLCGYFYLRWRMARRDTAHPARLERPRRPGLVRRSYPPQSPGVFIVDVDDRGRTQVQTDWTSWE